ncbi:MAG: hypothetical protein JRI23_04885 [Deltaproteobacteria bacterium]|jgi:hypothetical protein|nr:hypothetical protein [Deltaproteobacteria bacterium]MBW2530885.1 hypothetical protein [Deltaproteobacteria bacterium]
MPAVALVRLSVGTLLTAILAPWAQGGCSYLVDSGRVQCDTDEDCVSRGAAFADAICVDSTCEPSGVDPAWACLGAVAWPEPPSQLVALSLPLVNLVTSDPLPGVAARACEKLDPTCEHPLTPDSVSDGAGLVVLTVEAGFDGYIELRSAETQPALFFLYPPVREDLLAPALPLFLVADFQSVAQASGNPPQGDLGHVFLGARDCLGAPAEVVTLSGSGLGQEVALFYLIDDLPVLTALATDSSGRAGFVNVAPGTVVIHGTHMPTGQRVGEVSLRVRAGEISYSSLVPSP